MTKPLFQEPPISYDGSKWFCIVTNPNCQKRAELELYAKGFRTFVPKIRKWVSHARVRKAVEKPLLGRYVFVEVDHPRQSFASVRGVNGVETIVSNLGIPSPFPSRWVEDFRMRYMAGEWDFVTNDPVTFVDESGETVTRHNEKMPIGARIRIVEGQFDDMLATVTGRKNGLIVFKLHGTNTYGKMHLSSVRAA